MNKSTVTAGVIAGLVAACASSGLEAVGDTMHDAGEAIAGAGASLRAAGAGAAGELLAAAGHSVATAGETIAEAGTGGTSGALAQEITADGLPRPHWVLRDKSGTPVQADVSAGRASDAARFGTSRTCVYVSYYGQRRIDLTFDLASGRVATSLQCDVGVAASPDINSALNGVAYYLDSECKGPAYSTRAATPIVQVDGGKIYFQDATLPAPVATTVYRFSGSSCTAMQGNVASVLRPWVELPADVTGLLPSPPYSLELVY
jgi:hypothetical protein